MRVIIFVLGFIFLETLTKHWGMRFEFTEKPQTILNFLFGYCIILDILKK